MIRVLKTSQHSVESLFKNRDSHSELRVSRAFSIAQLLRVASMGYLSTLCLRRDHAKITQFRKMKTRGRPSHHRTGEKGGSQISAKLVSVVLYRTNAYTVSRLDRSVDAILKTRPRVKQVS